MPPLLHNELNQQFDTSALDLSPSQSHATTDTGHVKTIAMMTPLRRKPSRQRINNDTTPSLLALAWGHCRSLLTVLLRFVLRNSNGVLLANIIHHLAVMRRIFGLRLHRLVWSNRPTRTLSKESRTLGTMHIGWATLAAFALFEQTYAMERAAVLVLTIASLGQARTTTSALRRFSDGRGTMQFLRDMGVQEAFVFMVSSSAFFRLVRRRR